MFAGLSALGCFSSGAAQSNAVPLSEALAMLSKHATDGFIVDRGSKISQATDASVYEMAFTIIGLSDCRIVVEGDGRGSPYDAATCKGYAGTNAPLATAAFSSLLRQLRLFVGKSAYIYVADTREGTAKLKHAEYATDDRALISIDMTERNGIFEIMMSVRPAYSA
jgi:hypothetical protein